MSKETGVSDPSELAAGSVFQGAWTFKHRLVQMAALASVPRGRQQELLARLKSAR